MINICVRAVYASIISYICLQVCVCVCVRTVFKFVKSRHYFVNTLLYSTVRILSVSQSSTKLILVSNIEVDVL